MGFSLLVVTIQHVGLFFATGWLDGKKKMARSPRWSNGSRKFLQIQLHRVNCPPAQ